MSRKDKQMLERFGVTDEQLTAWEEDASRGILHGEPRGEVVIGRPRIANEPLRAITITLPESMVLKIDGLTGNRSDFIRRAISLVL